jgi:DNA-binding transcriptional LysR family regulator
MNLQQLRQLVVLAEVGGFRRAAEKLCMTQPPLSSSMRRLEEDLGVVLFLRLASGVTLTDAGKVILDQARQALLQIEQIRRTASSVRAGEAGRVRLGFVGSATYKLLPQLLPKVTAGVPHARLELHASTTERILKGLDDGSLDLGIVRSSRNLTCRYVVDELVIEDWAVALPMGHRFAARSVISLHELADDGFVLFSAREVPHLFASVLDACKADGFVPRVAQEGVELGTVLSLVESGLGVALVPSESSRRDGQRVALRRVLAKDLTPSGLALAYRPDLESLVAGQVRTTMRAAVPGCSVDACASTVAIRASLFGSEVV